VKKIRNYIEGLFKISIRSVIFKENEHKFCNCLTYNNNIEMDIGKIRLYNDKISIYSYLKWINIAYDNNFTNSINNNSTNGITFDNFYKISHFYYVFKIPSKTYQTIFENRKFFLIK
jgi:hypothetical protein